MRSVTAGVVRSQALSMRGWMSTGKKQTGDVRTEPVEQQQQQGARTVGLGGREREETVGQDQTRGGRTRRARGRGQGRGTQTGRTGTGRTTS